MAVSGSRINFEIGFDTKEERVSEIQLSEFECFVEGVASTILDERFLSVTWLVDDQEETPQMHLVSSAEGEGRWKLEQNITLNGSIGVIEFLLYIDKVQCGLMGFYKRDLVELNGKRLSLTFGEYSGAKIQASAFVSYKERQVSTEVSGLSSFPTSLEEISQKMVVEKSNLLKVPDDSVERIIAINNIGLLAMRRFSVTNNLRDIDTSISFHRGALDLVTRHHPEDKTFRCQILMFLCNALQARYQLSADSDDFNYMISTLDETLELSPREHPATMVALTTMGGAYLLHFQHTLDLADIDKAIDLLKDANSLPLTNDTTLIPVTGNLGNCYTQRYWVTKDLNDIENSIKYNQRALEMLPLNHPQRPMLSSNIAGSLVLRFREVGNMADFDRALSMRKVVLRAIPESDPFFAETVCNMGNSFLRRFEYTKSPEDINEAINLLRRGVHLTPEGSGFKPRRLTDLGNLYLERSKFTKNPVDAESAIENYRLAQKFTSEHHPHHRSTTENLINAIEECFHLLDDMQDIDEAISRQRMHVASLLPKHRTGELHNLSRLLYSRFLKSNDTFDIQEAIARQQEALQLSEESSKDHSAIAKQLLHFLMTLAKHSENVEYIDAALAFGESIVTETEDSDVTMMTPKSVLWLLRFKSSKDLVDIDRAISNQRRVIERSADSIHKKYLGSLLLNRFRLISAVEDIEEAISMLQQSYSMTSSEISDALKNLSRIANSYLEDYYDAGSADDFENALTLHEEALKRCPLDHQLYPTILGSLGSIYMICFQRTGKVEDIHKSISTMLEALELTAAASPSIPSKLNSIGKALCVRFERTGNRDDLETSIRMHRDAISQSQYEGHDRYLYLTDLGNSLLRLFLLNGQQAALEEAITLNREAVDGLNDNSSQYMVLSHLGNCLLRRFELTGNLADIDETVSLQQAAVQATIKQHIPLRTNLLNLGNAYFSRSRVRGNADDAAEAVAVYRKAISLLKGEESIMKAAILDNLAMALENHYYFVKDVKCLNGAIMALRDSLEITPPDHPFRPMQMNYVSTLYKQLYQHTRDVQDVEKSIDALNEVLEHPARTLFLEMQAFITLGWALMARFHHTKKFIDIDASISYYERALDIMPDTHLSSVTLLTGLAKALETRYKGSNSKSDLTSAVHLYQQAAANRTGLTTERLNAAIQWAETLRRLGDSDALYGYATAIELLPTVAWLGETISDRHVQLSTWSKLVGRATAAAISWNRLDLALQWLEEGRNIVWNQLSSLRTPLDDLCNIRPDLADELQKISKLLEKGGSRSNRELNRMTLDQKIDVQSEARVQRELAEKWQKTLSIVRTLPGFESFLRPAKITKIFEMVPPGGIVVIINVDDERCDAIALHGKLDKFIHIPLEKLTYTKAEGLRQSLIGRLSDHGIRSRSVRGGMPAYHPRQYSPFEDILIQLWMLVVKPILTGLELRPSKNPPRLWWCATGPLAFLPIHAAGIYTGNAAGSGTITSEYIISSYTPTLSTLFVGRQRKSGRKMEKLLIVTQPNTPNMGCLPQTVEEGKGVEEILKASGLEVDYLEGTRATVEKVIDSMENCNWIHLACHAVQDPKHPTKSSFYFHDGNLELSTLIGKQLPHADFAFLSACETGTGDENLPEEAVHLAAGVLQAGYRSVVATMWAIDDNYAPMVSESFYSHILEKSNPPCSADTAYALQEAAKEVRRAMGNSDVSFLSWVPFIHFGIQQILINGLCLCLLRSLVYLSVVSMPQCGACLSRDSCIV